MRIVLFIVILLTAALSSCGTQRLPALITVDASPQYAPDRDVIFLDATGYGATRRAAYAQIRDAVYSSLLLTGIPNTAVETPLLVDLHVKHRENIIDDLIEKNRFERYTLLLEEVVPFDRKTRSMTHRYKVNLKALRDDLLQQRIIRPFGI